jgi:hypothetical protein
MPLMHPEQLGFKLGLKIFIGQPARITDMKPEATTHDVVYVALFADTGKPLEKGDALKVGQCGASLKNRWRGICGIFEPGRKHRNNEKSDAEKWLRVTNGKVVSVWVKAAEKIEIPYTRGLTKSRFSIRCAEEEFLDQYYEPKLGMTLNRISEESTKTSDARISL